MAAPIEEQLPPTSVDWSNLMMLATVAAQAYRERQQQQQQRQQLLQQQQRHQHVEIPAIKEKHWLSLKTEIKKKRSRSRLPPPPPQENKKPASWSRPPERTQTAATQPPRLPRQESKKRASSSRPPQRTQTAATQPPRPPPEWLARHVERHGGVGIWHLLDKKLKQSDVSSQQNRLLMNGNAEHVLKEQVLTAEERAKADGDGLAVRMIDGNGGEFDIVLKYYSKILNYRLIREWCRFVKAYDLKGDLHQVHVWAFRLAPEGQLFLAIHYDLSTLGRP